MPRRFAACTPLLLCLSVASAPACNSMFNGRPVAIEHPTSTSTSGVRMTDLVVGSGAEAHPGSRVSTHYVASLPDGTRFDSSYDRGAPQEFTVGNGEVVAGWDEGMSGMRAGGKRRMVIPPGLAYGSEGIPGLIPPDSDIVLVVDLLEVREP